VHFKKKYYRDVYFGRANCEPERFDIDEKEEDKRKNRLVELNKLVEGK